jgi:hypothetical protein
VLRQPAKEIEMTRRYALLSAAFLASVVACAKDSGKTSSSPAPQAAKAPVTEPTPAAPPAAPVEGKSHVEGQGFVVDVKPPAEPLAAGQEGVAQVVLNATGEYHLNKDFPNSIDVTAPDGVQLSKLTLKTADAKSFEKKQAVWEIPFKAATAGEKKFAANFKFAVCTETTCDPKREALGWLVAVK